MEISITKSTMNMDFLDSELRAALGALTSGVSARKGQVIVHLDDSATPAQIAQARRIVEQHDASKLSPTQQERADRAAKLEQMRRDKGAALDGERLPNTAEGFRQLARKLAWLEQEIEALRKGE
jgi:multidrug resistance efflux pump